MPVYNLRGGTISLSDGSGTPIEMEMAPLVGGFSFSGYQAGGYEAIPVVSRGVVIEHVPGNNLSPTFNFAVFSDGPVHSGSVKTIIDAVEKKGLFASGTTIDPGGVVWTVNMTLELELGGQTDTLTLTNCRLSYDYNEDIGGNQIPISGTATGIPGTLAAVWS